MSLKDVALDIIAEIQQNNNYLNNNHKYIRVCEDQFKDVVYEDLYSKMQSRSARRDKKLMSVNLNIKKQERNKLSQLYTSNPERTFSENQEAIDYLIKTINPDSIMQRGSELYNTSKSVLVEVFLNKKYEIKWRAIANDSYWLYTTDLHDPSNIEIVVKIMKEISYKDEKGKQIDATLYFMYSDEEMIAIDSNGKIHPQYMREDSKHSWDMLPFVQVSQEAYKLMISTDIDSLGTIMQINSIFTDATVASYYLGQPSVVVTNCDVKNSTFSRNADDLTVLNPKEKGVDPKMEVIASKLDSDKNINLAMETLKLYLNSKGLVSDGGNAEANASGISLMIQNADTSEVRKIQVQHFTPAESGLDGLWSKTAKLYNWLIDNKLALMPKKAPKTKFSDNFEMEIEFGTVDSAVEQMQEVNDGKSEGSSEEV